MRQEQRRLAAVFVEDYAARVAAIEAGLARHAARLIDGCLCHELVFVASETLNNGGVFEFNHLVKQRLRSGGGSDLPDEIWSFVSACNDFSDAVRGMWPYATRTSRERALDAAQGHLRELDRCA